MAAKRKKSKPSPSRKPFNAAKFDADMAAADKEEKKRDLYLWQAFIAAAGVSNPIINWTSKTKIPGEDVPHMVRYAGKISVADVLREIATRPGFNTDEREAINFAARVVDHSVNELDNGE